jgi:hypothetical protein
MYHHHHNHHRHHHVVIIFVIITKASPSFPSYYQAPGFRSSLLRLVYILETLNIPVTNRILSSSRCTLCRRSTAEPLEEGVNMVSTSAGHDFD